MNNNNEDLCIVMKGEGGEGGEGGREELMNE